MNLRDAAYQAAQVYLNNFDDHELSSLGLHKIIMDEVEAGIIESVLLRCGYNQVWAAQVLGLSRNTLRKVIMERGLPVKNYERRRMKNSNPS